MYYYIFVDNFLFAINRNARGHNRKLKTIFNDFEQISFVKSFNFASDTNK